MKLIILYVFVTEGPKPRKLVNQIWQSGQFGPTTGNLEDFFDLFLRESGILEPDAVLRKSSAIAFLNTLIQHKLAIPMEKPRKISKKKLERFRGRNGEGGEFGNGIMENN
jgi:hypothetical protein